MNPTLAFSIFELALSLAKAELPGKTQDNTAIAATLLEIARKAAEAYQQHTGETLNPSLIRIEEPISIPPPAPTS